MAAAKRILVVSDFKDEQSKAIRMQPKMWVKGLIRAGCDVQCFSFRAAMMRMSPITSKKWARKWGKPRADKALAEIAANYHPDIVFILGLKYLDAMTIETVRAAVPSAVIVARDEDPHPEANSGRIETAAAADMVLNTSAGSFLQMYKDAGIRLCGFVPNMCDPDLQKRWPVDEKWRADIIFTGKPEHTRLNRNDIRFELVERLGKTPGARVYGAFGVPRVEAMDYFYAISGAKVGLSINVANDVQFYHSDRFINYISCGALTIAKRVPDTDLLAADGRHAVYFEEVDEFFELADYYLKHEDERRAIADAGMAHAHEHFNCKKIAGHMLEIVETGECTAPWKVIL